MTKSRVCEIRESGGATQRHCSPFFIKKLHDSGVCGEVLAGLYNN